MVENKTQKTTIDVASFLAKIDHPTRHADALVLDTMFRKVTGWKPRMWGPTIVGYGSYDYTYDSGHSGTSLATGFSPRKSSLSIYILPGYTDFSDVLSRLGKHKIGKSCLYINKLADIDQAVLAELIRAGVADLGTRWPIKPS